MARKSKKPKTSAAAAAKKREVERITMEAINAMSDDEDGALPPESEWNEEARALKNAIVSGAFDHLLKNVENKDTDEESIPEVVLDDSESAEEEDENEEEVVDAVDEQGESENEEIDEDSREGEEESIAESEQDSLDEEAAAQEHDSENESAEGDEEKEIGDEVEVQEKGDDASQDDSDDESEELHGQDNEGVSIAMKNTINAKALHIVTDELVNKKHEWPWAETFDIVPPTKLPFGKPKDGEDEVIDIHDDLKREVAFYNIALEAVSLARQKCKEASIPFSRPEDYFAEMVKTDEHMAKVKDRLIFENKKMEAVAQRKANKEQKLRAKEAHSNKLAEKSKRKKEHLKAVEEWAQSAAMNRGGAMRDDDDARLRSFNSAGKKPINKKRAAADRKFGHGGKRGRFKQNDPSSLNDMSGYNKRGNFGGIGTKKTRDSTPSKAGGKRPGKRARDASRSRR